MPAVPPSSPARPTPVCPGCHGRDFVWFGDGFGDGDRWFYCYTCGTEACVDVADIDAFVTPTGPPRLSPPFLVESPLPRRWPGAMTPSQIREWAAAEARRPWPLRLLRRLVGG